MNTNTETKSAKSLVVGDRYRPYADKRYANQWNVVTAPVRTGGGKTVITYKVEGVTMPENMMHTASLATMEVKA